MNSFHLPRRSRARLRLTYGPSTKPGRDAPQRRRRRTYSGYGVLYLRCGGGYQVLRRERLPGDDDGRR